MEQRKPRRTKNPLLQGNVWSSVTIPESLFLKIRNTRQTPLNLAYNADSFQDTDHLHFPLMANQAAMPKVKSASPVLSGILQLVIFSLKCALLSFQIFGRTGLPQCTDLSLPSRNPLNQINLLLTFLSSH